MSNFFSSPWFLETSAEILFPGARPATVEVEGRCFDVLLSPDGRPAISPLVDFYEPRDEAVAARAVPYLPAVSHARVPVGSPGGVLAAAPLVDWSGFGAWKDFVTYARGRDWRAFDQPDRKLRKIAREVGPVQFSAAVQDHRLVERMLLWKSQQLRQSKRLDRFVSPRNRQLIHRLVAAGHLRLSVMFGGDRPLAVQLGHWGDQRYSCWITAFDPIFAHQSPGALLFEHQMRESWERGHREFDFLIGGEAYKQYYATHERRVGPVGRLPLGERLLQRGRRAMSRPRLADACRAIAGEVLQRTMANERPAPGGAEGAECLEEIARNGAEWPRPRLERPADCQMLLILEEADARLSPMDKAVAFAGHTARRARGYGRRRIKGLFEPDAPPPPAGRPALRLRAGERVRVKTLEEIRATLGDRSGPWFIPPLMERFAGQTFRVHRPVFRFFDERTRRVLRTRNTVLLDGNRCDGCQLHDRRGCDRGCLTFWREDWLERVPHTDPAPAPPDGERVRVRSLPEIERGLDPSGAPFVRETMAAFAGRTFTVHRRAEHAYDERRGRVFGMRGTVLDGVYCPGIPLTTGGVCERSCALLWREEWLEPARD